MPTPITKYAGPGKEFTTWAQISAYINGRDMIARDEDAVILLSANFTVTDEPQPATSDANHRIRLMPDAGQGVNDLHRTTFDYGTSGIQLTFPRGQYGRRLGTGVTFHGFRVLITGSSTDIGAIYASNTAGPGTGFYNCRLLDQSLAVEHSMYFQGPGSFRKNLVILEGAANKRFLHNPGTDTKWNTFVARGAALGTAKVATAQYGGGSLPGSVFIGFGSTIMDSTVAAPNCFANTTPTGGTTAGIAVNTAAGALVVNETSDFRPKAGGALIGASATADETDDILGNYCGTDSDVGAWQLTPADRPALPLATITSVAVAGRRVTVTATFTSTALSGMISLVPAATPNGAAAISKAAAISGSTATAVFDLATPGSYAAPSAIMVNQGGAGTSSGGNAFTVSAPPVPTAAITVQSKARRTVTIVGTYTGIYPNEPITGTALITASSTPDGAVSKGPVAVNLKPDGTFGVTLIDLQYGSYVSTAVSVANYSGTATATGPAVTLVAPSLPVGSVLTDVKIESTGTGTQTDVPVTFGQVFKEGDFPVAGAAVELRLPDDSVVPCQLDLKAAHPDGSVRHAVLSAIIPALAASASITCRIVRAAAGPTGAAPVPANFSGLNATVLMTDTGTVAAGAQAGTAYTADAAALLAAGTYITWLSGPIVSEWILRVPLKTAGGAIHPDLHARFSIRAYAGQAKAKIDYIIENTWAKKKTVPSGTSPWEQVSVATKIYGLLSLKAGATTVHTRAVNGYTGVRLTFNPGGVYDGNGTGLANDGTVYTATVTVDGVAKAIAITGSSAQTYGQFKALMNSQMGGMATCVPSAGNLGFDFKSATTGVNSSVVITYGTLFPALGHLNPYRPIRGDEVIHYAGARWKKTFWWGSEPAVHVAHNKAYLMASKAVPNYAPELNGSTAEIATTLAALKANEDIGQNGVTKAYMGDVGYAPGIGLLPAWTAQYLVNQGVDAKYTMLKQADLQGSWGVHVRDYDTDLPISFSDWPYASFTQNVGDTKNPATGLNEGLLRTANDPWIPDSRNLADVAHHPDFCFLPYLVTGDHWYWEGLLFYQRFLNLSMNSAPNYRDGKRCLWWTEQPRGMAWSLRTATHTLYAMPSGYPLRAELEYMLAQNLEWYNTRYVDPAGQYHNVFGFIWHDPYGLAYNVKGQARTGGSHFMDDYITAACGRAVELGYSEWMPLFQFKAKCPVGRLTSGADYCWQLAATGAAMRVRETEAAGANLYTTWRQVYEGSFSTAITSQACGSAGMAAALTAEFGYTVLQNAIPGYPTTVGGYPSNTQPAVAYAATYDVSGGDDAWTVLDSRTQKPDYNLGPQFAIVPRAAESGSEPIPLPVGAPADNYTAASGQAMYFGRTAP